MNVIHHKLRKEREMRHLTLTALSMTLILAVSGAPAVRAEMPSNHDDDGLMPNDTLMDEEPSYGAELYPLLPGEEPFDIQAEPFRPDLSPATETVLDYPSDGTGPLVETNYIRIYLSDAHPNGGSGTDYIYMKFGQSHGGTSGSSSYNIKLWGYRSGSDYSFPLGYTLTWDLQQCEDTLAGIPQDHWDEISLVTTSGDGMLIHRVVVVHSGMQILNWTVDRWLDSPRDTTLGCAAKIMDRKLDFVDHTDHAGLHFGALDLGKTNGYKYGDGSLWCSEFASWCIWKEGLMTPAGSIGTENMKNWFGRLGRLYTRDQVKNKTYVPKPGDYLSINNGDHSCIFLKWLDSTGTISDSTRFRTLDGNWGQRVTVVDRDVSQIDRVGCAQ